MIVAADEGEACRAVDDILVKRRFGDAGSSVVVEQKLEGEEVSVSCWVRLGSCWIRLGVTSVML